MNTDKIVKDHARKSKQVKELKKTVKRLSINKMPLALLKHKLAVAERTKVDPRDYQGWDYFDDEGYGRAESKREGRIELLKELISECDPLYRKRGW